MRGHSSHFGHTLAMVLATARMPVRTAALGPALPLGMEDCRSGGAAARA